MSVNFVTMKKSTIWILGVVMGLSFISLLYLQISYIEEMVKMRNEQFDESVKRALMAASKDVESAEVDRWLREDISEAEKRAWEQSSQGKGVVQTQRFTVTAPDGTKYSAIELKTFSNEASELPRAMISRKHGTKTIPQTSRSLADAIKNRYLYQRALLDEVAWQMIYRASDKAIEERVNFKNLDQYLKSGLIDNGIELNYHFKVIDRDGREVYRCSDYSDEGSESSYSQPLFLNDPPARMSIVKIHFPGKQDYIFDSVSFMIPSMIFTFVLLITFIFTIYIVFRQKKLTEMKNDFINNMTHEFKTPISTISLAAQMLKDPAVGKSPAMFQHISGVINDETKRLRFQVEKVLQMSMFDRQKATLKMKELDEKMPCGLLEESWIVGAGKYGRKLGMDFLHPAYPMVTESYVQDARDHGLQVNTWTVNDWDSMEYFARIGVHAIIGNFPDLAEKALNPYRQKRI